MVMPAARLLNHGTNAIISFNSHPKAEMYAGLLESSLVVTFMGIHHSVAAATTMDKILSIKPMLLRIILGRKHHHSATSNYTIKA
jgi:hypothetical protein